MYCKVCGYKYENKAFCPECGSRLFSDSIEGEMGEKVIFEFNAQKMSEAALYYLYIMADGDISYKEEKIFGEICQNLNMDADEKDSVIVKCREYVTDPSDIFNIIVREKVDEKVGQIQSLLLIRMGRTPLKDESNLARIIWNLVNLGYADAFYSSEEKRIVEHLVAKWSVRPEVYQEFIDIADTMLALTSQKAWIGSTFLDDGIRREKEKKVDSEIKQLLDDVTLTIQELTM